MDWEENSEPCCFNCSTVLIEPFIQCATCTKTNDGARVTICLHCFAKGVEFDSHKNDHAYSVVKNNFPVFERSWSAVEETQLLKAVADCGYGNWEIETAVRACPLATGLQLLKAVADCGYGNWTDIANKVRTKNSVECEQHYNASYVENPSEGLPVFPEADISCFPSPVVYKLCEDPPRPSEGSLLTTEMAGYMAGRGDFMTEHDNFMELDLRALEFDTNEDDQLETDLKFAVVDVYQRCLRERWRRKRIVRRFGLINMRKNASLRQKYDKTIGHIMDGLRVFTQCLSPEEYEMYLEASHYEQELKHEIRNLQEYREKRLTKLRHVKMFKTLRRSREKEKYERHLYSDVVHHLKDETACQNWLQRQATIDNLGKGVAVTLPNAPRRAAPPLDIIGLPGFDKLNSKEKELCSTIRLVPSAYLDFKTLLVNEYQKHGYIKLAQARLLIKIDVNKTRKIFDFLVSEGTIYKDPLHM